MKKICFYLLILSFLNYTGCYSSRGVSKEILYTEDQEGSISGMAIIMNEEKRIELSEGTYKVVDDTLYLKGIKSHANFDEPIDVKIALADIQYVEIDELDDLATAGYVLGLTVLSVGIILVIVMAISGPVYGKISF